MSLQPSQAALYDSHKLRDPETYFRGNSKGNSKGNSNTTLCVADLLIVHSKVPPSGRAAPCYEYYRTANLELHNEDSMVAQ